MTTNMTLQTKLALGFAVGGLLLMALTLIFRVNPVELSVVDPRICGTPLHWLLFFSSMPAWLLGLLASSAVSPSQPDHRLWLPLCACLIQVLIYFGLGWIVGFIVQRICRTKKQIANRP
jgi:hypothetical protein